MEVRVPISPTPDFFRRIHFMAASLRRLRAAANDHVLVVCVGGDEEPVDLYERLPWSRRYPLIWRWADRARFQKESFWETSHEIFRQPIRGRFVICADADVIFVRDFPELLRELTTAPAVAGVIAHGPAFREADLAATWRQIFEDYGVPAPPAIHQHTGWDFMTRARYTPVYYNFGMVIAPAAMMAQISQEMEAADRFVNARLTTFFRFQIALSLVIQKLGLAARALPLRYNFPNDPRFDQRYPEELTKVRVMHYLRGEVVHRENDFAALARVAALAARTDLRGSNEVLRRLVAELYPTIAAEETETGGLLN